MGKKDPRVDAYIAKSPDISRPILKHIRKLMHQADPQVEETLKWRIPTFTHDGIVCCMAAFKQHCALSFWKGKLILDSKGRRVDSAMGNFGRIQSLKDLPSDTKLLSYIRKAVTLNQSRAKLPGRAKRKATPLRAPAYLTAALRVRPKALATFKALSASHRNEYIVWISSAKQETTRARRLRTAVTWLAAGKNINWRYEKKPG